MLTLINSAGITPTPTQGDITTWAPGVDTLSEVVSLLTLTQQVGNFRQIFGLTSTVTVPGGIRYIRLWDANQTTDPGETDFIDSRWDQSIDDINPYLGCFLVRTAAVPEPSIELLLGISLVGLVGVVTVRKVKKKKTIANT